jgi:hypothetical protein
MATQAMQYDRVPSERAVLSALCQNVLSQDRRAQVVRLLMRYHFAEPSHQIIFQAIASMHTVEAHRIRELLPARVNNLGLPDVDLQTFFAPQQLDEQIISRHMEILAPQNRSIS